MTSWAAAMRGGAMVVAAVAAAAPAASGLTLHVPADHLTIQAALDAAQSGDTILVAAGVYAGPANFAAKDVAVIGAGAAATTLEGSGSTIDIGPGGVLRGFTVTNAPAALGCGITLRGAGARIEDNVFEPGPAPGAFGCRLTGNGASPTITGNLFRGNVCGTQHLDGVLQFFNGSEPAIANNVFVDNPCPAINITLPEGYAPLIVNNTMVGNRVGVHVDRRIDAEAQIYRNNLIVGNEIGVEVVFGAEVNNPVWEHNLVFGNGVDYAGMLDPGGSAGNLSLDPLFVAPLAGDYHLQPGSPAVDAGTALGAPAADLDGEPRPQDADGDGVAAVDIGADERPGVCAPAPRAGCKRPTEANAARLTLTRRPTRQKLDWSWRRGAATEAAELGDPAAATGYAVCVYDARLGGPVLVLGAAVPAGGQCGGRPCWRVDADRVRYLDAGATVRGIREIDVRAGAAGRSRARVRGTNDGLVVPALPLAQEPEATVQLVNDLGVCWEARFAAPAARATDVRFRDRGE